jgi:hypothetical protein
VRHYAPLVGNNQGDTEIRYGFEARGLTGEYSLQLHSWMENSSNLVMGSPD